MSNVAALGRAPIWPAWVRSLTWGCVQVESVGFLDLCSKRFNLQVTLFHFPSCKKVAFDLISFDLLKSLKYPLG